MTKTTRRRTIIDKGANSAAERKININLIKLLTMMENCRTLDMIRMGKTKKYH